MDVVQMVLGGLVNKEIVSLINKHGGRAVGITGKDGDLIRARKLEVTQRSRRGGRTRNHRHRSRGRSGNGPTPDVLDALVKQDFNTVIAPIGVGPDGESYNINADLVAGRLPQS